MFINPKSPNYAPNQSIILSSIKPYILGFILSSINTPSHISALIHIARHTFATMMLTLGADLYTVSKLLGHTDLRMTQVYAKIINQKKNDAVNLVNTIFK